MTVAEYNAKAMDTMFAIGRKSARKGQVKYCADPEPTTDFPLPAVHAIGAYPNHCACCMRTQDAVR